MSSLALLLPRLVADRWNRAVVSTGIILALTTPLVLRDASDYTEGLAAGLAYGAGSGSESMAATSVLAVAIALVSSWFADGVVSELHRDGTGPLLLVRPLPRMALFLSRWLSGFVALAMTCLLCSLLLNLAWQLAGGQGRIVSDTGAIAAAAVAWIWVASCVFLLSTVLERGEAIIGALLFLLPLSLAAIVTPGSALSAALAALPSKAVLYAARALLSGGATEAVEIARCVVWGAMVLAIGTLTACRREWRTMV